MAGRPQTIDVDDDDILDQTQVPEPRLKPATGQTSGGGEELARARAEIDTERRLRLDREKELATERGNSHSLRKRSLDDNLAAAKADAERTATDWQSAMDAADFAKAKELLRNQSRAEARLVQLEQQKEEVERAATRTNPDPQPKGGDPAEEWIASIPSAASRDWLRQHKDAVTDPEKNKRLVRAHHTAEDAGFAPDSPQYFKHLEVKLGYRRVESEPDNGDPPEEDATQSDDGDQTGEEAPAAKVAHRKAAVAAPPTRQGSPSTNGQPSGKYKLSPQERQAAAEMNMPEAEYAALQVKRHSAAFKNSRTFLR